MNNQDDIIETTAKLLGSYLLFTRTFFYLRTGHEFILPEPPGRNSHVLTIAETLTDVFHGRKKNVIINVPPRYGKTICLIHFVAWSLARNPQSNYLYVSYSHELATKQTATIKQIIEMPHYQKLFDVRIRQDSRAKDNFETTVGGSVYAAGTGGTITGRGAGIKGYDGFGGCVVIDDSIKPDEATSDTVRARINEWFDNTLMSRLNQADKTPIIFIGQRVHEDDLANKLIETGKYHLISIPALDLHDNPLQPEMHTREMLLDMKKTMPYVFASQYQQDPIPAGGGIFKTEWFKLLDDEPEILMSFITVDTAETDKTYNDATVFSFWGLYKIKIKDVETELYGLHWLDCQQLWCEPADLESEFFAFYADCMRHTVKPSEIVIEKKSTGTTLSSVLSRIQGLRIVAIERTKASGSKTTRYLEMQPFVASKQISLPSIGKHARMCIEHMGKITANNTHRNDDVCHLAGSKIATIYGNKNVEDITIGDKVITPFGIGTVSACGLTGFHKVINKFNLDCTPNHKIFYDGEFIPLMICVDEIRLNKLSFMELLRWKQRQLLYLMEKNLDFRHRRDISKAVKENIKTNFFIVLHGSFITKRKFLMAILFTIKTIINMIIVLKIWSVFHISNTVKYILKERLLLQSVKKLWRKCGEILKSLNPHQNIRKNILKRQRNGCTLINRLIALFVKPYLLVTDQHHIYAPQNVNEFGQTNGVEKETNALHCLLENAYVVQKNLKPRSDNHLQEIAKHVHENAQDYQEIKQVYNLTVDIYGVYYCNGILVSNCDTAFDACKLALIDKTLLSRIINKPRDAQIARRIMSSTNQLQAARRRAYGKSNK